MPAELFVSDEASRERLVAGLQRIIQLDCIGGRKFLAEKEASGESMQMPPRVFETIKKNIDVREAVLTQLIDDIQSHAAPPISADQFYSQILLSFAKAPIPEDPDKREYTSLILDLIPPSKEVKEALEASKPLPEGTSLRGFVRIKPEEATHENIKLIEMRAMTIDRVLHVAFDEFYLAATGKAEINPVAPDYVRYMTKVETMLERAGGRSGPA